MPLTESIQANREPARHATKKRPLDYFHVNSIADGPGGTILISGRNTSALYLLRRDGSIVWRLGGKRSDFGPAAAVKFRYQHNARFHGPTKISLFDNGAIPKEEPYTRPLVLKIDPATKTAKVVKTFVHPKKLSSPFEGNLELLPDGGAFVGWGGIRKLTEFSPAGRVLFELTLPYGDTYRGYRLPWTGNPGGEAARRGRRRPRLRELERQARDRALAGARRAGLRPPRRDRVTAVGRARDDDRSRDAAGGGRGARARRVRASRSAVLAP